MLAQYCAAHRRNPLYLSILANRDSVCMTGRKAPYPISANTLVAGARRPLGQVPGAMALLADLLEGR